MVSDYSNLLEMSSTAKGNAAATPNVATTPKTAGGVTGGTKGNNPQTPTQIDTSSKNQQAANTGPKSTPLNTTELQIQSTPGDSITMTVRVFNAVNIRGSKGEHVNSFVRAQFADFDYKDSVVVNDNANPEFNLSYEQSFNIDEVILASFLLIFSCKNTDVKCFETELYRG